MAAKKKYYAVLRGRKPGIYTTWFGSGGAEEQVRAFTGARFKGFEHKKDAEAFMAGTGTPSFSGKGRVESKGHGGGDREEGCDPASFSIRIYSDGGAIGNPGPGGYGTLLIREDGSREEFSGGFALTTNNRMELLGAIIGLEAVRGVTVPVLLTSDSRYLVQGIEKGWARGWRARGWKRADGQPALNPDLWGRLLDVLEGMEVRFCWVKGHSGHPENERCDVLAQAAARSGCPDPDPGYGGESSED